MIEIWRAVVDYEGYYEVSNFGRVKRLAGKGCRQERILKGTKDKNGYLIVCLYKDGKKKTFLIHRLVGMAFPDLVGWIEKVKGKPFEELEINHKDQNKENNHISNLEWCDQKYNLEYGDARERMAKTMTNGKTAKHVAQKTKDGELIKIWSSVSEIERQTGWRQGNISACCQGKRKSAYGSLWSYTKKAEYV